MRISDWSSDVCSSDLKQGVTGKHANGFPGKFSVEQCVGKMIECLARRLQYADFELADPVAVPLACRLRIAAFAIGVRPVQTLCPCHFGQDRTAGNEVLLALRRANMSYSHHHRTGLP